MRRVAVGDSPALVADVDFQVSGEESTVVASLGDEIAGEEVIAEETDKEKAKREKAELEEKLREFGGKVGFFTLFTLATPLEKAVFWLGCLCAIGHGTGQIMIQYFFGDLTDALDAGDSILETTGAVALKLVVLGAGVLVAATIYGFAFPWFVERQLQKIRPMYFDALIHRDVGWFDTHEAASLSTEMMTDVDQYAEGLGVKFANTWMASAMFVGGYIVAFSKSWQLTLVMTGALPVMLIGFAFCGKASESMIKEEQAGYAKAASVIEECLFAIRTVVSFGGERRDLARFGSAVEKARQAGIKTRITVGAGFGYFMGAMIASFGLAFWYGASLKKDAPDALTGGDIFAAFGAVLMGGFAIGQGLPGLMENSKAKMSMARFFWLIKNEPTIQRMREDNRRALEQPVETFELKEVHFSYPSRPDCKVLNGVNLKIDRGQKVALVGESGSGKSTVMALLERFYDATEGTVLVNGQDIKEFNIRSIRRFIGYVGQEPVLFATSVEKNIRMGCPDATDEDVKRVVKQAQLSFVDALPEKLATYVGSGGSQFSGGQKQRIAIARALLKKPSVLFLDEATSALDNKSERMIQATIDDLSRNISTSMGIVSIAHRLSTIQNCDVIFVFRSGIVVESGSHEELISQDGGLYQALAAAQKVSLESAEGNGDEVAKSHSKQVSASRDNSERLDAQSSRTRKDEEEAEKAREKEILKNYKLPVSRLMSFCKPEWPLIPPGILFAGVSGACFPIMGCVILTRAIAAVFKSDWASVNEYCLWFVVFGSIRFVCQALQFTCFAIVGEALTKRCRIKILTTILSQEIGFHDDPENTPGQLAKALQIYSYRVQRIAIAIGDSSDALCTLLTGLGLAFYYSWQLSLFALAFLPILGASQTLQQRLVMGGAGEENATLKKSGEVLQEALTNAKTVHACGSEQELVNLYAGTISSIHNRMLTRHSKAGVLVGFSFGFIMWFIAAIFYFMAWLLDHGHATFEDAFGAFMGLLYGAMMAASAFAFTGDIGKAKVSCHDMFKLIDRRSQIDGLCPIGLTPDTSEGFDIGHFDFEGVCFYYPFRRDVQVLSHMSFSITAGTSVGVVGPSGGGKSTIMALIQRFYDPQEGVIYIGGGNCRLPLNSVNIRWWRKQVGFVGQEPILFGGTVLENVKYGVDEDEMISDDYLQKCKEDAFLTFLDSVAAHGWQTQVGPRGARLSGGQKQRVAICRALIRNPRVILLDEATSALDSQSEQVVSKALERARKGRTSFAIAHRLSTVQDCDTIVVVANGKIVEQGSHKDLMLKGGVYHKLSNCTSLE